MAHRRQEARERTKSYKRLFSTTDGRIVLFDLFKLYGFDDNGIEKDDFVKGDDGMVLARRDGMKSVIRHILRTRNQLLPVLGEKPKRGRAKSGPASNKPTTHEP